MTTRNSAPPLLLVLFLSLALLALLQAAPVTRPALTQAPPNSPLLDSLLRSDPKLAPVISRAKEYEVQIIYTQINRDAQNQPHFTQHNFHLDARQYFNPASLVKLPVSILALEKLNQLNQPGLTRNTLFSIGTAFRCQTPVPYRTSSDSTQLNTVGNYIKRMLLVSDNQAYNRLYEFLGQHPLNERLWSLGYPNIRITRRFAPCDTAANRHTNPFTFYSAQGQPIYKQPPAVNRHSLGFPLGRITKGRGYQQDGRIISEPYNFTTANYMPLQQVTDILKAVIFPTAIPKSQRFDLTPTDYNFLRTSLSETPHGSKIPYYTPTRFHDAYKKYLYYGRSPTRKAQSGLRIHNVVGMSHGYLADVAYFADSVHQTEFMLSAVLYVNKDGILNDGTYEYESIGLPFLACLGYKIHGYERQRVYKVRPDLNPLPAHK